jgi:hypothetical protein
MALSKLRTIWFSHDLSLNAGTFTANDHNITLRSGFGSSSAFTRVLNMGSGTWTINFQPGQPTPVWNISGAGLTLNGSASSIVFDISSTAFPNVAQFVGGGFTYGNFRWAASLFTTNALTVTGANTFTDFQADAASSARTLTMPAAVTNTATAFSLAGSAAGQLSVVSSSPGTQATLSQSGGTVSGNYLTIQDSAATGGATFNTTNSVNVSNNSGWNFQ